MTDENDKVVAIVTQEKALFIALENEDPNDTTIRLRRSKPDESVTIGDEIISGKPDEDAARPVAEGFDRMN